MVEPVFEIEVEIKNADGLHMRPAMQFVDIANQFKSEIIVSNAENSVRQKHYANEHARGDMRYKAENRSTRPRCPKGSRSSAGACRTKAF